MTSIFRVFQKILIRAVCQDVTAPGILEIVIVTSTVVSICVSEDSSRAVCKDVTVPGILGIVIVAPYSECFRRCHSTRYFRNRYCGFHIQSVSEDSH